MGIVLWIVLGAFAGWIASIIMGRNRGMGWIANTVVGIIGAALGGWISSWLLGVDIKGFNLPSLLIAIGGACLLLLVIGLFRRKT
jgi:uncharacterized membrane protein YeaQ/YmgE (transglycosylase-associated protein family)